MARTYLGGEANLGGHRRVFEIEGALEIDENDFTQIERTRVYFDDVLGITYHQQVGVAFLVFNGVFGALFVFIALVIAAADRNPAGGIVMGLFAVPFVVAFLLRLVLKVDVITVYGKRTKATIRFGLRKGRARTIYSDLTAKVRARQAKALAEQPPPPAPAASEIPLPPPPPPPLSPPA
jgi:hypothetical protein